MPGWGLTGTISRYRVTPSDPDVSPPLLLRAGISRPSPQRWAPDTKEYPGAWKSLCKSRPGINSIYFSANWKNQRARCRFHTSSFNGQESHQKLPPGYSGLKRATHTTPWVKSLLGFTTVPGELTPTCGRLPSQMPSPVKFGGKYACPQISVLLTDDPLSLTICHYLEDSPSPPTSNS